MEKQLTDEQIKIMSNALTNFPSFSSGAMTLHKIGPEIIFNNSNLSLKVAHTFIALDNWQSYYCISRRDGNKKDADRHFIGLDLSSSSLGLVQLIPIKTFLEHHNPELYNLS